jgi:hypothetical protein
MDARPARIDAWPLLPRPAATTADRPEDDPARAALTTMVGLAALFLVLRNALPESGLAAEMAMLVALAGCKVSFALTIAIMALLVGAAIATPMMRLPSVIREYALNALDHAVHLALVLSVAGVLGIIVLHEGVTRPAVWFTGQAMLLWGCHRTRLWLCAGRTA